MVSPMQWTKYILESLLLRTFYLFLTVVCFSGVSFAEGPLGEGLNDVRREMEQASEDNREEPRQIGLTEGGEEELLDIVNGKLKSLAHTLAMILFHGGLGFLTFGIVPKK